MHLSSTVSSSSFENDIVNHDSSLFDDTYANFLQSACIHTNIISDDANDYDLDFDVFSLPMIDTETNHSSLQLALSVN